MSQRNASNTKKNASASLFVVKKNSNKSNLWSFLNQISGTEIIQTLRYDPNDPDAMIQILCTKLKGE